MYNLCWRKLLVTSKNCQGFPGSECCWVKSVTLTLGIICLGPGGPRPRCESIHFSELSQGVFLVGSEGGHGSGRFGGETEVCVAGCCSTTGASLKSLT